MSSKERILKAAGKFFGTKPYAEVSIAPILAIANVQPPTLYYHFGDKEGLYVAWVQEAFGTLCTHLTIKQTATLADGLAAYSLIYFNMVNFDVPQVVRDVESLVRTESKEQVFGAYFQAVYEPLCAILIEGMERGELPSGPIGRIADLFLAGLYAIKPQIDQDPAGTSTWLASRFLHGHQP